MAATLLAAGCHPAPVAEVLPPKVILKWMQCQECRSGEEDSVVAMGNGAVLDLRGLLINGPPEGFVSRVDAELRRPMHRDSGTYVPPAPLLKVILEDFRSIYRVRASMALGAIGGDSARHALCAGKAQGFTRPDVLTAIDSALAATGGACP